MTWGNFFVTKLTFTYIVFLNGYINITGIKSSLQLHSVRQELCKILNIKRERSIELYVDNICSKGQCSLAFISLQELHDSLQYHLKKSNCFLSSTITRISYRPEKFPSLHIKTKIGTILLFGSGKFVFVGYKKLADANYLYIILNHCLGMDGTDERHCGQLEDFACKRLFA